MAGQIDVIEVIHAGAAEIPVAENKAAGLNDIDGDGEARPESQYGGSVLGNVGLEKGHTDGHCNFIFHASGLVSGNSLDYTIAVAPDRAARHK
mgnify:CR=1 FL=1